MFVFVFLKSLVEFIVLVYLIYFLVTMCLHWFFFIKPTRYSVIVLSWFTQKFVSFFLSKEDIREDKVIEFLWKGRNIHRLYNVYYWAFVYLWYYMLWGFMFTYRMNVKFGLHLVRFFLILNWKKK